MLALGIDIGGTMIKTAIVDSNGTLSEKRLFPTSIDLKDQLLEIVREELAAHKVEAIGIGTAGRVDPVTGNVNLATSNLANWTGVPVKTLIQENTGVVTAVLNDSSAAAFGEWFCNYRRAETLVMITVGSGLGGGIVINCSPLLGKRGEAAEFGHIIIHRGGKPCNCGKEGCAEQYISMRLIHSLVAAAAGQEMDRATLIEQYLSGNPVVEEAVSTVTGDLAIVVDSVFLSLDPDLVVVGGGVCELGKRFLNSLREELSVLSRSSLYTEEDVVLSLSGNDAGIIGAAVYAMAGEASGNE
ncbi:MAG: ROK family protein [Mesotoga sp.]|uniref:ROK family protein n=2 Tax=Mesotoga sp. TaxID=2053577 RepID=UPI00262C77C5|nr:ROK family protein [Mesotoga sp.]MDD4825138.1 ROK family protein [Mesotoga sp.]